LSATPDHPTGNEAEGSLDLIAFQLSPAGLPRLAPAPRWRTWMNETHERWANRCLPLLVANEAGWVLLNPYAFQATWTGSDDSAGVRIEFEGGDVPLPRPESHFGYGIVTWTIPYLFRTPSGYNLLVRGPANWPKDGVCPLEGLVETDWAVATFTMNWKITRPGQPVTFEADEPFCMVVPQRRAELRSFRPQIRDVKSDPEAWAGAERYAESRHELSVRKFLGQYSGEFEADELAWQRHYFRGLTPDGRAVDVHETQLRLPDFAEPEASEAGPADASGTS
jgi:hypothetical protein